MKYTAAAAALTVLLFAGCSSDIEETGGEDYLLSGYYMIAGDETPLAEDSRATAPVHWSGLDTTSFSDWVADGPRKVNNYPERHQKTYITVSETAVDNVFFISSRTEYPNKEDIIDYYLEEYYVMDEGDGIWNGSDSIVEANGTVNPYARETMEVVFQDGSVRKEWIADLPLIESREGYASFAIDDFMYIPENEDFLVTTADSEWSSKVYYYQKILSPIGYFSYENKEIFGVRYYTEVGETSSTLIFEQTLSREQTIWENSFLSDLLDYIFGTNSTAGVKLADTVIRESINRDGNGKKETVAHSLINTKYDMTLTVDKSTSYDL